MRVEIEISGDKEFCDDENGVCQLLGYFRCKLAPHDESLLSCDLPSGRFHKCQWCLRTYPVDTPEK